MACEGEILTNEDCSIALHNYAKEAKLLSFSLGGLSSVEGVVGQHFKVKIQYEKSGKKYNGNFFLKVLDSSLRVIFDMAMSLDAYGKEEFLYDFLSKQFNSNGIDTSFAPKFYMCRPYLLLIEDISQRGYKLTPKKELFNIAHCKIALKALAKFHSSAIIYEEIKSKERGAPYSLVEAHPTKFEEKIFSEGAYSKWFKHTMEGILHIIHFLPANEITAETYIKKLVEEMETFSRLAQPSKEYRNTIIHGDLWSNNIMFRYEDDAPVDAILIDYQLLHYGKQAMDVVELILKSVRRSLRSKFYDELLMFYYQNFCKCLDDHSIKASEILILKDFLKSCDEVRLMKKVFATAFHSALFVKDMALEEAVESEEAMEKSLYHGRCREIMSSYDNNELFREILQEDLIEVRDMLFCK